MAFAAALQPGVDFEVERALTRVRLTDAGRERVEDALDDGAVVLAGAALPQDATRRGGTEAVTQALSALWLYHRDQQYMMADGKVQIIDETTGRVMADSACERGLHQLIEAKGGGWRSPASG